VLKLSYFQFDGEGGNIFKNECASYCGNQSAVLSFIKDKTKKDQNFKQFLQVTLCRFYCYFAVKRNCRPVHLSSYWRTYSISAFSYNGAVVFYHIFCWHPFESTNQFSHLVLELLKRNT